jgi:hypothetical protein
VYSILGRGERAQLREAIPVKEYGKPAGFAKYKNKPPQMNAWAST